MGIRETSEGRDGNQKGRHPPPFLLHSPQNQQGDENDLGVKL